MTEEQIPNNPGLETIKRKRGRPPKGSEPRPPKEPVEKIQTEWGPINPRLVERPQNRPENIKRRADGTFGSGEPVTTTRRRYKLTKKEAKEAEHRQKLLRLVELSLDPRVTMKDIVEEFGVHRKVIERWKASEEFQALYDETREGFLKYGRVRLQNLLHDSFRVAGDLLQDRSGHVRFEMVSKIWDTLGLGKEELQKEMADDREALRELVELQKRALVRPQTINVLVPGQPVAMSPFAQILAPGPEDGIIEGEAREASDPQPNTEASMPSSEVL